MQQAIQQHVGQPPQSLLTALHSSVSQATIKTSENMVKKPIFFT